MARNLFNLQDSIGLKFNRLTIIGDGFIKGFTRYLLFKCDCGIEKTLNYQNVKTGLTKSCGCLSKLDINDYIGKTFGKLKILSHNIIGGKTYVDCICDCGKTKNNIYLGALTNGGIHSCGCDRIGKRNGLKHGSCVGGRTRLYKIYIGINSRCNRILDSSYIDYGGRGIVCNRINFQQFKDDMEQSYLKHVEEYGEKETTIERIDNNGNYCKENCRRATTQEQGQNRRNNIIEGMSLRDYCIKNNGNYEKILRFIKKGHTLKEIEDIGIVRFSLGRTPGKHIKKQEVKTIKTDDTWNNRYKLLKPIQI